MKHKIITTESQYEALLGKMNRQRVLDGQEKHFILVKVNLKKMSLIKVVVNIL